MGVISLQGEAQAKLIEHKLLQTLEPEVIDQRRLICGDAYAFQGDEREIIFLSMVAAPGATRIGAMTNDAARQRFNVAASRAQDQLWLFHTATLDVLSPACMRHHLLSYMLNPGRLVTEATGQKFDSQFERDIFGIVVGKGFHVRTQVCVGDPANHRYRIDLVVEGMQGRLAVECDGDEWHGPDRYEQDMARQRDLERDGSSCGFEEASSTEIPARQWRRSGPSLIVSASSQAALTKLRPSRRHPLICARWNPAKLMRSSYLRLRPRRRMQTRTPRRHLRPPLVSMHWSVSTATVRHLQLSPVRQILHWRITSHSRA